MPIPKYAYSEMMMATKAKMQTCSFLTNQDNVIISDLLDPYSLPDSNYPLIKLEQGQFGPTMYEGQINLSAETDIIVKIFIRQEKDSVTNLPLVESNQIMIMDSATEALNLIYSFEDDKLQGNPPCQGYIQVGGATQIFANAQLDDVFMVALFVFSIDLINLTAQ